jgi:hypothetical protein
MALDLRTKVVFHLDTQIVTENYTPKGHFVGTHEYSTNVKNMDEFRKFITNFTNAAKLGRLDVDKATYGIHIKRNVIVYDANDLQTFESKTFSDSEITVILSTTDKLFYVADIEPLLKQKIVDFEMDKPKFITPKPIYLSSVEGNNVKFRPLKNHAVAKDIIIDTNLNQIYPIATNEPPLVLTEMFSKTTEKIR